MADQIVNEIKIQYETVEGLKKALKDARKELDLAKVSTVEWTNALEKVGSLQSQFNSVKVAIAQATQQTTAGLNTTTTASANASMALLNLNYVIRDSPYFFNNFALGVLAVGNNLNPLIDSFSRLREEAGAKSLSTFALLKQALVGGAGISIAFSVVVTAIQSFVFWQSRANKETEGLNVSVDAQIEKIGKLRYEYNKLQKDKEEGLKFSGDVSVERLSLLRGSEIGTKGLISTTQRDLELATGEDERTRLSIELGNHRKNLKAIQDEIKYITYVWTEATKSDEKDNKVLKEKHTILKNIGETLARNSLMSKAANNALFIGETDQRQTDNLPSLFPKPKASDRTGASGMIKKLKDMNVNLETGKIFAQQLGDTLAEAFSTGTLRLKEFIQSLIVAISKMLILRAITSFLTGGIGGGASSVGAIPSFAPSLGKGTASLVYVEGKIVADGTKFVADFNNFSNRYTNKIKVGKVGRS